MFNTTEMPKEKERLFNNILTVLGSQSPFLASVVWMNENFENVYSKYQTDIEVYEHIFDHFKIKYKKDKNEI